ncbi:MAG: aminoacyl-histidine dipeptidase [Bacteroidetes bacterium]|nr:aminoacyl-histidine dipeptidase [Bacteroidota bacterium]
MKEIKLLEPKILWQYFENVIKIPRPSGKEEKIRQYLVDFGKEFNLETVTDKTGNVLIRKNATSGMEAIKPVVLQGHMDIVAEKNTESKHDFENDPISAYIDGEWITANGTTLGADDGIGIAAMLAVLSDKGLNHGPIECLFTVEEETGLTGAKGLEPGLLNGKTLINLDSEDEGELFIGCAGGIDTLAILSYKTKRIHNNSTAYKISVNGLKGGHSGDDIDKGLGNSNKILNRILWNAARLYKIKISNFDGGNLRNAIPREASAVFMIKQKHQSYFEDYIKKISTEIRKELAATDPGLVINYECVELTNEVIRESAQKRLLNAIYACPHGVVAMSQEMKGMVETSTNLASVKFIEGNRILITTSQRSSVDSAKQDIADQVASTFHLAKAKVEHTGSYPGWAPNPDSEIAKIVAGSYEKLFNEKPVVRSIHAGLECGLFLKKYPDLDMISVGPQMKGVHSPDEKLHIGSTQRFWKLLVDVLENMPEG